MLGAVVYGVLGLIIGSFLNVVVIRRGALALSGRSVCLSCGAQIRWYDNIPVLSWLVLRGKCRACGSRISVQYPLVESAAGILFALLAYALMRGTGAELFAPLMIAVAPQALLVAILLGITVYDLRHTIIPDAWVYSFCALACILGVLFHPAYWYLFVLAGPMTALPLLTLWYISKGAWMGLGDVKLALGIGFFLGPAYGLLALLFAFIIGAFVSVFVLLPLPIYRQILRRGIAGLSRAHQRFTMKSEVPFGPFLFAAFILVWFAILYDIPLPI